MSTTVSRFSTVSCYTADSRDVWRAKRRYVLRHEKGYCAENRPLECIRVTFTSGIVIFGKVPCEKWFKQGEIHYKSEVLWYQMKAKRSHFHYISPYNSIPCCLADNDALKICNFAENCRKMHFGCCHGNLISLTYCFVSDRSRLWWSTLPESFKYFDRCSDSCRAFSWVIHMFQGWTEKIDNFTSKKLVWVETSWREL